MLLKIIVMLPVFIFWIYISLHDGKDLLKERNLSKKEENYISYLHFYVLVSMIIMVSLLSLN
jgi:hypothetical protein